jgi:predicted Zn finger-like uncharacterized protein
MIVTCPSCSARYKLDRSRVSARGAKITCPRCKHVFVVYPSREDDGMATLTPTAFQAEQHKVKKQAAAPNLHTVQPPAAAPKRDANTLDFRTVGISSWKVKVKIGLVYDFSDIKTLRKYIQDGRVTADDVISHDGQTWVTIGDLPDLDAYFVEVYDRAEAALRQPDPGAASGAFDDDEPTNIIGIGTLGNSLAAKALAAEREVQQEVASAPSPAPKQHVGPKFADPFAALKEEKKASPKRRPGAARGPDRGKKGAAEEPKGGPNMMVIGLAAVVLLGLLGGGAWWWVQQQQPVEPVATPSVPGPIPPEGHVDEAERARLEIERAMQEGTDLPADDPTEDGPKGIDDYAPDELRAVGPRGGNPDRGKATPSEGSVQVAADFVGDCKSFYRSRDWGQAKMACSKAQANDRASKLYYGVALYRSGDPDAAQPALQRAAAAGMLEANKYLGDISADQGDVFGASSYYQKYLDSNPTDASAVQAKLNQLQGG